MKLTIDCASIVLTPVLKLRPTAKQHLVRHPCVMLITRKFGAKKARQVLNPPQGGSSG